MITTRASGRRAPRSVATKRRHARVPRGEAVVVDEVLPDRHRVAAAAERLLDQLAVRLARARARRAARCATARESVDTSWPAGLAGFAGAGSVDTSRVMAGFAGPSPRSAAALAHRDPGRLADSRSPSPDGRPSWPARCAASDQPEPPQREYLLLFVVAPRRCSCRRRTTRPSPASTSRPLLIWPVFRCPSMAGFGCPPRRCVAQLVKSARIVASQSLLPVGEPRRRNGGD